VDLEWERWAAIGDAEAEALAAQVAGQVRSAAVEVRQQAYAEFVQEEAEYLDEMLIRPAIPLSR
jgi:hypothetical protein